MVKYVSYSGTRSAKLADGDLGHYDRTDMGVGADFSIQSSWKFKMDDSSEETTCSWLILGAMSYALSRKVVNTTDEKQNHIC